MLNKRLFSVLRPKPFAFYKHPSFMVSLVTRDGVTNTASEESVALNWQLAKVWVNPQNDIQRNSLSPSSSNSSSDKDLVTSCSSIDFERYMRKIGKIISRESTVYVQDGVYNSKNVRIVSSEQSDAQAASSILSGSFDESANVDAHILYLTEHPKIGKNKKFLFWDEKRRILLSNSGDLDKIREKLDKI